VANKLAVKKTELPTETTTLRHYIWESLPDEPVRRAPSVQAFPEHVVGPKWPLFLPQINLSANAFDAYATQGLFLPIGQAPCRGTEANDERARPIAQWFLDVLGRFKELSGLPANWDHHGAPPVEVADLAEALKTLSGVMALNTPTPAIVPISGGGLQLEWHRAGLDVEIVVGLGDEDGLYFHDKASGGEWEGPTREGFAELNLAQRLIG
jgi:hypothetical protein